MFSRFMNSGTLTLASFGVGLGVSAYLLYRHRCHQSYVQTQNQHGSVYSTFSDNPGIPLKEYFGVNVDPHNFNFSVVSVNKITQLQLEVEEIMTNTLNEIVSNGSYQFDDTFGRLIETSTVIDPKRNFIDWMSHMHPEKDIRDAANDAKQTLAKFFIDCTQRLDVYDVLKKTSIQNIQDLTLEEEKFMNDNIRDLKREGLDILLSDPEKGARIKELKEEMSDLCTQYSKNLNEENTTFQFTREQLSGLPDSWFDSHSPDDEGMITVTLKYPDFIPANKYVHDRNVRQVLTNAFGNRCAEENSPIFEKVVALRHELIGLLGYETYADYSTEVKVAKTKETALNFVNNLNKVLDDPFQIQLSTLLNYAIDHSDYPLNDTKFERWDMAYYKNLYILSEGEVDSQEVQQYFELNGVIDGTFSVYQDLLGLTFSRVHTQNVWHPTVTLHRVTDTKTADVLGYFYLDMYPREGKFAHAAAFDFINGHSGKPHVTAMVCNFPKTGGVPFSDVETFFHEFGHIMHQICSKPQLPDHCGFGVEWDFVEAPSQMLENWVYDKNVIKRISRHVETGETLPDDIIDKIIFNKTLLKVIDTKTQLMYATFDLRVHTFDFESGEDFNAQQIWYQTERDILGFNPEVKLNKHASFGHLMGGYAAGYYGYLFSRVFAANMYYRMFESDPMDPIIGSHYRTTVLEPGATRPGLELVKSFIGGEPDEKYLLQELGL